MAAGALDWAPAMCTDLPMSGCCSTLQWNSDYAVCVRLLRLSRKDGGHVMFGACATRPTWMRGGETRPLRRALSVGPTLTLLLVATSCANASQGDASCALGFVRGGATFYPYEAAEPPPRGRPLGQVPSITCDDGDGEESEPEFREAVAIRGIDPAVAFLVPDESPSTIFAPGPPDGSKLTAEVENLLPDS